MNYRTYREMKYSSWNISKNLNRKFSSTNEDAMIWRFACIDKYHVMLKL